jgi:hypothetical protein
MYCRSRSTTQAVDRKVAGAPVVLGDPVERGGKHRHLTQERLGHHLLLHLVDEFRKPDRVAGEPAVDAVKHLASRRVDEQRRRGMSEVVANRARDGPMRRERFAMLQNLFGKHVKRPSVIVTAILAGIDDFGA